MQHISDEWSHQLADHQQQDTDERDPEKREQQRVVLANVVPGFFHVMPYDLPRLLPKRSEQCWVRLLLPRQSAFGNRQNEQGTDHIDEGNKREEHIKGLDLNVQQTKGEMKGGKEHGKKPPQDQKAQRLCDSEGDVEQRER